MAETTGMLLGKFLPPHEGHRYLVDFARNYCDRLTVLVCSIPSEPIPGDLRFQWMQRMFPDCEVVHVTDDLPQEPADAEDFWDQWRRAIRERMPSGPDYVFASEDYGQRLADELGAEFVPVDIARELVPVSGSAIREDPMANWRHIPREVRPYFVRRVCVFGPESTGKTTLARRLAEHFDTVWAHEYARPLLDRKGGVCDIEDIERIARGQAAAIAALEPQANRVLFSDTDALTTKLWSHELFAALFSDTDVAKPQELRGRVPALLDQLVAEQHFDLTLLCGVDVPFVPDAQRYFDDADARRAFFDRCEAALMATNRRYVVIKGSWSERDRCAIEAVADLLGSNRIDIGQPI